MSLIQEGDNKGLLNRETKEKLKTFIENNGGKVTDPDFSALENFLKLNPLDSGAKTVQNNTSHVEIEKVPDTKS